MRNEQSKITWGKKRRGRSLKVLVVVMPDTVVHPRAVVVHLEHALPAHPTQMTIKTTRFKITKKKTEMPSMLMRPGPGARSQKD